MNSTKPVDYQAALDQFRKSELEPETTVQAPFIQPDIQKYIDYEAVVKAWNKQKSIQLNSKKKNASRDPD